MRTYYNTVTNESFTVKQAEEGGVSVEIKEGLRLVSVLDFQSRIEAEGYILETLSERQVA